MSNKKKAALSRRPGVATALYVLACAVFATVTFWAKGMRLPSSSLFVNFLTGVALAWTLDVLARYAADTRRLADAAEKEMHLLHRPFVVIPQLGLIEPLRRVAESAFKKLDSGLKTFPPAASRRLTTPVHLENAGHAPAFDVLVAKSKGGEQEGVPSHIPLLKPGQSEEWTPRGHAEEAGTSWSLEIRYTGLSGASYYSRYEFDGMLVKHLTSDMLEDHDG